MKALKFLLGSLYPLLVILLLLGNLKCCCPDSPKASSSSSSDTTRVIRQAEETGHRGALKVTLLWNFDGDIDLHVMQPNGVEIYFNNDTDTLTGGFLDVDNRAGGDGSAENIYWENPQRGDYCVSLVYFQKSNVTYIAGSGNCSVVVFQEGKSPMVYDVPMRRVNEHKTVCSFSVD